jgi:hypothetical protein
MCRFLFSIGLFDYIPHQALNQIVLCIGLSHLDFLLAKITKIVIVDRVSPKQSRVIWGKNLFSGDCLPFTLRVLRGYDVVCWRALTRNDTVTLAK